MLPDKKDITVLMAVHNGGRFLKKSVDSVLRQTAGQFEFVIVDDCSSDGSAELIRSYSDPRIVLYENKINQGQTKSLNIGLKRASGRYIARMDADDMAFPCWLEKVYSFAMRNEECSVVSSQAVIIDELDAIRQCTSSPLFCKEVVLRNIIESPINHVGALMCRKDIISVGGYDEKYAIAADYDLWTRLLITGRKIANMKEALTAIRIHALSSGVRGKDLRNAEVVGIMIKNIRNFTDCNITDDEIRGLWTALHRIKDNGGEACDSYKLLRDIYGHIKPEFGFSDSLVRKVIDQKTGELLKKRIFIFLRDKKYDRARDMLKKCMLTEGKFSFFGLVYILSFFPVFVENIEAIYYVMSSLPVKVKFGRMVRRLKGAVS